MQLDEELAKTVFRKVRQVREEVQAYCLAHDRPDLPVEEFQRIVGRMYQIRIDKRQVPFEARFLRGLLEDIGTGPSFMFAKISQKSGSGLFRSKSYATW